MGCKAVYPRYVSFKRAMRDQHNAFGAVFGALHVEPIANAQHVSAWAAPASRLDDKFHSSVQFGKPLGNTRILLCHKRPTPNVFLASRLDALDNSKHVLILPFTTQFFNPPRPVAGPTP